ncbi:hypothetical protein [Microbacterium aurantiacum]|uniref:hypothetical protein n=1 Tax=Microbacterium aurantiacum TaxID=162393 RepID=UPI003437135F
MTENEPTKIQIDPDKQPAANLLFEQLVKMRNDPTPEGRAKFEADLMGFLGRTVMAVAGLELELRALEKRLADKDGSSAD